jgi:hypothetical protein
MLGDFGSKCNCYAHAIASNSTSDCVRSVLDIRTSVG